MVVQAVSLAQLATRLGVTVPAVVDLFAGQGIDLSGFGESDIIPLEDLLPESELNRIKKNSFRTIQILGTRNNYCRSKSKWSAINSRT